MGEISVGFIADAVLLDANPMEDITNTRRVRGVLYRGDFLNRSDLDRLVDN
jgi:imidazolonepropionase-like amidohydrolase